MPTPIATLSGSASPSCMNSQPADLVDQPRRSLVRGVFVGAFEQDAELVAADPRHHVAVADALGQQVRDLDQRFVAGAVAEACR